MWRFGTFLRTVSDLDRDLRKKNFSSRIIDHRAHFPIVIIDDQEFTDLASLLRYNFNTHFSDLESIGTIARYHIVLCDLIGVGTSLSKRLQGAQIIREIKKSYPEKFVIAYTGGGYSEAFEHSISIADRYLKKDANIEEWSELLDEAIDEISNPAKVWRKIRQSLLEAEVTPYQLARLEDVYVSNALKGRQVYEPAILAQSRKLDLTGDARNIIASLISSMISDVLIQ